MLIFSLTSNAQSFYGPAGAITDNAQTEFSLSIASLNGSALKNTYGLESIELNLQHNYLQDISIALMAPDGSSSILVNNQGGNTTYYTQTIFHDNASLDIQAAGTIQSPYTGTFKPVTPLGNLNNFQTGIGTWRLLITDNSPLNTGNLISWKLNFSSNVPGITDTFSSNIPIVLLNTIHQVTNHDSQIVGSIKIIDHQGSVRNRLTDSIFTFFGKTNIKDHGQQSINFPQRSFSIELLDSTLNDTTVEIMGMPKESDWLLLNTWNDRSFVRNPLMYHLFQEMGHYATRFRFCEVFLNGSYQGIYQFTEKIKRDPQRVAIAKLKDTDLAGDSLTGGYIFKHDYVVDTSGWLSDVAPPACPNNYTRFQYVYPSRKNIHTIQADYLRHWVDSLEFLLFNANVYHPQEGYSKYLDLNSFADYLICNEFAWNGDGFSKSMFFYKHRDSIHTKLFAGPVWDFDWSLKKMPWINDSIDVWSYNTTPCNNLQATLPWHSILMQDSTFRNLVRCRYNYFRTNILSEAAVFNYIDQTEAAVDEAQIRHYTKWPTWGQSLGTPEQLPYANNMTEELDTLKAMISRRLQWMDLHLPGVCLGANSVSTSQVLEQDILVYPNPTRNLVYVRSSEPIQSIRLYNVLGETIYSSQTLQTTTENNYQLILPPLHLGVYVMQIQQKHRTQNRRIIIN